VVDFKKKRVAGSAGKPIDPREIYDRLDRASDKGPLRNPQERVLKEWHEHRRAENDVILKLHTGQGKTLVGLLMLQSKMNEESGRAVFLCPNLFLASQTLLQSRQFGLSCVGPDEDGSLPASFLDGQAILVITVQKLFNGLSKFGLNAKSIEIDYMVIDDAHACIDSIRSACQITLSREHDSYQQIVNLFEDDLKVQGAGSYAEIRQANDNSPSPILPIPYWSWIDREEEVTRALAKNIQSKEIKFAWPLLRDKIKYCQCVVSAHELVIVPHLPPLDMFGSYANAKHRIFMSATVTDDAFLVKGLGLEKKVVLSPLTDPEEGWSGERMILIPSITSSDLDEGLIVANFGKPDAKRRYNIVVLSPSFYSCQGWDAAGAIVARPDTLDVLVGKLRNSVIQETVAVANRYDGIDLPDDACRILILDGKPFGDALWERYIEECRPESEVSAARIARTIEQGLGRAVRGEKDYCVVIITGSDLVRVVRAREIQKHLSDQTKAQVRLGMDISSEAQSDIKDGSTSYSAFAALMRQCLERNDDWKEFYKETMDAIVPSENDSRILEIFVSERESEIDFQLGRYGMAVDRMQAVLDGHPEMPPSERGWYLQEIARYEYPRSHTDSQNKQLAAHRLNHLLLKPESVRATRLSAIGQKRSLSVVKWVSAFDSDEEMVLSIEDILGRLKFGVRSESFEKAWQDLGVALGFASERPDKEWKEGPDNLWALKSGLYLLVECKNEVELTRAKINKDESGQMNNSCAWFDREYSGSDSLNILIIPTAKLGSAAGFNKAVRIMKKRDLNKFTHNVKCFFNDVAKFDRNDLDEAKIHNLLGQHRLAIDTFEAEYTSPVDV
jgi:replicative superfamily II helicase